MIQTLKYLSALYVLFMISALNLDAQSEVYPNQNASSEIIYESPEENMDSLIVELAPRVFFYDLDFKWVEFTRLAKDIDKPFFVEFYATWCPPCKLMDKLVYSDPTIADYVNNEFMAYKVNAELFEGMDLVEQYRIKEYPTVLFFNAQGKMVGRESGLYNAEGFMQLLKKYLVNI